MSAPCRHPVQREKAEQAGIIQLARTLRAEIWVLGTRRGRGKPCPKCGTFVAEHQGLRQTPGHPDLLMFLPVLERDLCEPSALSRRLVYWETKVPGGRLSDEQRAFQACARAAGVECYSGTFDDFVSWTIREGYCRESSFTFERLAAIAARQGATPTTSSGRTV